MKQHTMVHSIVLGMLLVVWPVAPGRAPGQEILTEDGIPRPSYPSGFAPGARVTLLDDNPAVGPRLTTGMSGTIICCDADDCSGAILVSWDLWSGGGDEEGRCVIPAVGLYPPGSTTWVGPSEVRLGLPFDKVGTLQEDPAGCLYLEADDGGVFNIVVGTEFRNQWWVVKPGDYVRLRGLLNRGPADAGAEPLCPQRDGDVYHPIMSLTHWTGTTCCDRWVCGFNYGGRVVLIAEDDPHGAADLPRGRSGTIICCRSTEERSILVSWDLWGNGGDDEAYTECSERLDGLFPPGSTWWVSVEDIAKYFQSECGVLRQIQLCSGQECLDLDAVGLLVKEREVHYLPDAVRQAPLPSGDFRAAGLFTLYDALLDRQAVTADAAARYDLAGMILHSILIPCPEPSCCEPPYVPGDRVRLLVDMPGGAAGLVAGAAGDVVCCNADDPVAPILVSWDGWTGGDNDDGACDTSLSWYPDDSGWWMACTEIAPLVLADLYDAGESYRAFSPESVKAAELTQPFEVTGMIGNRGGATSSPFFVDIRASLDKEIAATDALIGRVVMQLAPGGSAAFAWKGNFPANIPSGIYYVGWIIDPENRVEEEDETNNAAIVEAKQLTVISP